MDLIGKVLSVILFIIMLMYVIKNQKTIFV